MNNKKLCSLFLAIILAFNMSAIMPLNAFAIGSDSKVYENDGYTVTYKIGSEWDNNRTVEVTIENTGEESILNWALKYDIGGEVSNLWNSKLYDSGEDYVIIKNNGYNYEIEPEHSVVYGYIVTGEKTVFPENIELCSRRIDVKSGYDIDFNVTNNWQTGFQADVTIENTGTEPIEAWTLTFDGNFTINNVWNAKLLFSDNGKYEVANQLWTTPINPGESASFGFTADKSATENVSPENYQLTAVVIGESTLEEEPVIDYELDTDEDGLPDYYEDILGTDKNNADTDSDGLSDSYEILYLGTDPLKADSDDNGINDGDEDLDNDGLTNAKECELGTGPNTADTDSDGLSDGAEVNTHGTDPLKYDTDEDGISDGDEITLGLNPNSAATDGIPDSERTFSQTVTSDSEVLSEINSYEENPFKVSLEIKSAGVAEKNLTAYVSGYSAIMQNDAVIGFIPQFSYNNSFNVEEVTVKFELDSSIKDNVIGTLADESDEFAGIKRLNIFKYFEDINMLLPVETFHDTEKNIVYTTTDCLGTYCLMDMEIWLNSICIDSKLNETTKGINDIILQNSLDNDTQLVYNIDETEVETTSINNTVKDHFNVVFILDTRGNKTIDEFVFMKERVLDISRTVLKNSPDARIYIFEQTCSLAPNEYYIIHKNGDLPYFTNYNDIENELAKCEYTSVSNKAVLSDALTGVKAECDLSRETFVFSIFDQEEVMYRYKAGTEVLDDVVANGVNISVIAEIDESKKYGYAHDMYNKSNGILVTDTSDYTEEVLKHIYGTDIHKENKDTGEYQMILATGLTTVKLDDTVANIYGNHNDPSVIQTDKDNDGLTDYEEINFDCDLIKIYNGLAVLPTYGECINYKSDLTYVERGLFRFEDHLSMDTDFINYVKNCVYVLPIVSDPTSEDGDKDTVPDIFDAEPLTMPTT